MEWTLEWTCKQIDEMEACMGIPENDDKSLNIKEGGFADKNYDLEK